MFAFSLLQLVKQHETFFCDLVLFVQIKKREKHPFEEW